MQLIQLIGTSPLKEFFLLFVRFISVIFYLKEWCPHNSLLKKCQYAIYCFLLVFALLHVLLQLQMKSQKVFRYWPMGSIFGIDFHFSWPFVTRSNIFPILGGFFVNNVVCQSNHFCKTYNKANCYKKKPNILSLIG